MDIKIKSLESLDSVRTGLPAQLYVLAQILPLLDVSWHLLSLPLPRQGDVFLLGLNIN